MDCDIAQKSKAWIRIALTFRKYTCKLQAVSWEQSAFCVKMSFSNDEKENSIRAKKKEERKFNALMRANHQ